MNDHRIIPMQCGDSESYALLFQEKDGKVVLDIYDAETHSLIQSLDTPFPSGGVGGIRHVQSFDVMFFAQGETYPCKLVRKKGEGGGYTFSFEDNEFLPEPILDWNVNSKHSISVFAIPDKDLEAEWSTGVKYYPKGVVREYRVEERATLSYSGLVKESDFVTIRYFTATGNSSAYNIGQVYKLDSPVKITATSIYSDDETMFSYAESIDSELVPMKNISVSAVEATFYTARAVGRDSGGVYFDVGRFKCKAPYSVEVGTASESSILMENRGGFYRAIKDAPADKSVLESEYYERVSGGGFNVALTVDGGNTNENLIVGQVVALETKYRVSKTDFWDYNSSLPDSSLVSPKVDVLEPLPSKKDYSGKELRPTTGGGYGLASEFMPARGEVELKTEGLWSGVIELQELDSNQNVNVIATITSENGNSNTSLTRVIDEFGSCVRVACTRREKAYQNNRSITGTGDVVEKIIECDEGLQWTLTSSDKQIAYVKILSKKTIDDGRNVYIAEVISGVYEAFTTRSYALGAWSTKNGYPEHIAIYQERLVYAGNKVKPTTLWLSKTNGWDDFELGTDASSAISATLATEKYDHIQWILPNKNGITIGTSYNEYSFGAADGGITTADNARATATSSIGSSGVRADMFGTATVMVKTGGEELYRIDYNTLSEESAGNQISLLASHLFQGDPVVDMFAVKAPSNMLFCLHKSGKLSSLTYEPEYSVTGWAQHEVLDGVVSGCALRRNGKDVLCLVVKSEGKYVLGEIDLQSSVWEDDGKPYESHVITTPISFANTTKYGSHKIIAGCDIYVGKESKQFYAKLSGGDWVRVDNGFDVTGELRNFDASRVEIPATSSWEDEAIVEVKSSSPEPLVLYAIGASIMA